MRIEPSARRQNGAALMLFALVLVLGTSWMLVSSLNKATADRSTSIRNQSGAVLKQAKEGLIGYVVAQAALSSNLNPGKFPCPEAAASAGQSSEGTAASSCSLPAIGRLPWKTLGIDKLTDGSGEPLWYVLSTGWAGSGIKINTDSTGNLTVDGQANAAIALIIAPGSALIASPTSTQIAAGCSARTQSRDAKFQAGPPDYRDYLECENASSPSDSSFVTTVVDNVTDVVFNDQATTVTAADIMPALDGVVAQRILNEIVPTLAGVYSTVDWNASGTRWFPFAAPFGDTSAAGSGLRGGTPPVTYAHVPNTDPPTNCTVSASDPRCNPTFVAWKTDTGATYTAPLPITTAGRISAYATTQSMSVPAASPFITVTEVSNSNTTRGTLAKLDCSATTSTQISCAVTYGRSCGSYPSSCPAQNVQPRIRISVRAKNVANAFKAFEINYYNVFTAGVVNNYFKSRTTNTSYGPSPLGVLRSDGDADITTEWLLPSQSCGISQCSTYTITIPINLLVDHSIVNSASTEGWFLTNEWYRVAYYAVGSGYAPGGAGSCSGATCLTVTGGSTAGALMLLAGRDLLTPAPNPARRPSSTLSQYLEGANATPDDTYETRAVSTTFNDRLIRIYP